jgi:flagellar protein FlaG
MSADIVTFDVAKVTTSVGYLSNLADMRRLADLSKTKSHDRSFESSQVQSRQVQVADQISGARVTFALDKETQELYIQVVDRETGEVLREIPPVEMRRLAIALEESLGNLFDEFA